MTSVIYTSQQKSNKHILSLEAKRIEKNLEEAFDYTNRISVYMGKQIAEHGSNDLQYILNLFRKTSGTQYKAQNLFSWSLFDWVAPNNLQLVNSKNGISKSPPDMSHREYTWKSPKHPWTLQVSKPAVGNPSGKWVIPAGTGIVDKDNNYLGAIVVGFNIIELTERVKNNLSEKQVSFIILDNEYRIVMQSTDNDINPASDYYKELFSSNSPFEENSGTISVNSKYNHIDYQHYRKIKGYPYTVLTGFNRQIIDKEFN
ncbi:cache domain-containing protein, partial [Rickettsiales bacterium]|nr:cache domain-containing protein [Rickettsiales bacterium]